MSEDPKKYVIFAKQKDHPDEESTRYGTEVFKDSDVAKGRADQLAFAHPTLVFSVVVLHQRS
eukprot:gene3347-13378_t